MTRDFDLADVLTITTGRLLSHRHMDGVYEILNYLTGDSLFTHQLPAAADHCRAPLLEQHPQLAGLTPSENDLTRLEDWLAHAEETCGTTLPVHPVPGWGQHNPIQELVDMVGPERVVIVAIGE